MATQIRRTQAQIEQTLKSKDDDCCGLHTLCNWAKVGHFGQWFINEHNGGPKSWKDSCKWACEYGKQTLFCCKAHQPPAESDEMAARCKRCALCCLATATVLPACCTTYNAHQQATLYYSKPPAQQRMV
ncbi:MAG: hypothetical protein K1X28_01785 [Parachlamydiales bacterium]|nr:hypothetical protein [Parachlamydiales bacterium]